VGNILQAVMMHLIESFVIIIVLCRKFEVDKDRVGRGYFCGRMPQAKLLLLSVVGYYAKAIRLYGALLRSDITGSLLT
jgi:hypothetical protein